MATSAQAQILPTAYAAPYTASGTIGFGCAVGYPDASGEVAAVTSEAPILGVAANAVVAGEQVFVVLSGPAYIKLAGTVTWATSPFVIPTTAGEFVAAAVDQTCQVRAIPDAREGASAVNDDIIRALVGVGAFHS
jgi:hypothetical protein